MALQTFPEIYFGILSKAGEGPIDLRVDGSTKSPLVLRSELK
jgi:hypothetical protein